MPKISLSQFSGEIPRLISRLLPNTAASYAENVRLDDGGLTPVRKSRQEHAGPGPAGEAAEYGQPQDEPDEDIGEW